MPVPFSSFNRPSALLLQFVFASMMVLALSGFTHLSMVIIYNTGGNGNRYLLALVSSFGNGLIIMVSILLVQRIFSWNQSMAWKYFFLNACIIFLNYWLNFVIFYLLANRIMGMSEGDETFLLSDLLFVLHPVMVGSFFFFYLTREQNRTRKISEQEYQLLELNGLKTKAELEALQAKINPHFLYNSLNSIASLVHINPDKAEEMVILLSKFFRYSTSVKSGYFHTLGEELEMVSTYLEVEKVRFDERLTYAIEYAQQGLDHYLIPRFLLQPLVENAIKHGISKIAGKGMIRLQICREEGFLSISIHDNGPRFPEQLNTSYGLQSTSDKLRMLCGEDARMELISEPYKHIKITARLVKETMPADTPALPLQRQPR
ncbi:histidine kinase [Rhodocytophaga aerolata]|uniref:Histidine kinase n=1 Tax=Rhodocytophaga aerolata TaxID=455078 RepID=A0ABT8RCD4_9BACT|nr:histidine kinase [Rhodocytophaga aerolata]MDO1449763.1 histidine kinase [Rhodocytophaga aerolata]